MTTIDSIVRGALFSKQMPIHYYAQFLHYAMECVKELSLDTLKNVRTVKLNVNEFAEAPLPSDFVDWTKVGMARGQHIVPLRQNKSYNRLPNTDADGNQIKHKEPNATSLALPIVYEGYWWTSYVNEYGEHIGRMYGGQSEDPFTFKIIRERNLIQLDGSWKTSEPVFLEYIYWDTAKADSYIHPYAERTIKAYIEYKFADWSQRPANEIQRRKRDYYHAYKELRGRLNPLSKEDIVGIGRMRFKQSIKQ